MPDGMLATNRWPKLSFSFTLLSQVAPSRLDFVRDLINVIDFIATLSFYSDMALQNTYDLENAGTSRGTLDDDVASFFPPPPPLILPPPLA